MITSRQRGEFSKAFTTAEPTWPAAAKDDDAVRGHECVASIVGHTPGFASLHPSDMIDYFFREPSRLSPNFGDRYEKHSNY